MTLWFVIIMTRGLALIWWTAAFFKFLVTGDVIQPLLFAYTSSAEAVKSGVTSTLINRVGAFII